MRLWLPLLIGVACTTAVPDDVSTTDATDEPGDSDAAGPDFSAVDEVLERALAANDRGIPGLSLTVWDANGEVVHSVVVGEFDPDARIPVASASKLITSLVLLRLIDRGDLSLTSTTAEVLGWRDDPISLDQLNAFVSGLPAESPCLNQIRITLQDCAADIADEDRAARPGQFLVYGGNHQQVAGAMAERLSGKRWNDLFRDELALPLGLDDPDLTYVALPKQGLGLDNPRVAGGLLATPAEYGAMLTLVLADGQHRGETILRPGSVDRLFENRHTGAIVGYTPEALEDADWRYGFGTWLECEGPVEACDVISSAGAFGMVPWVDREHGYSALLAMESDEGGGSRFSVPVEQEIQPLIVEALGR